MMIQYNKSFQTSICNSYGISEKKITLDKIIRVASKADMLRLKKQLIEQHKNNMNDLKLEEEFPLQRPFDSIIKLQEGIYQWDDTNFSYNAVTNGA